MKAKFSKILKKKNRVKIICLTAYSKNIAQIIDNHCDVVLVGFSWFIKLETKKSLHKCIGLIKL